MLNSAFFLTFGERCYIFILFGIVQRHKESVIMRETVYEQQEIDLLDFVWRILEQWRGLLLFSILFAVIASTLIAPTLIDNTTTATDVEDSQNANDISIQSGEDDKNTVSPEIPPPEMPEIDPATVLTFDPNAQYWVACNDLALYADYNTIRTINEGSIISKCDYSECETVSSIYEFEVSGNGEEVLEVANLYLAVMNSGIFKNTVSRFISGEADPNSLEEILSVSVSTNTNNESMVNGLVIFRAELPGNIGKVDWSVALNKAMIEYKRHVVDSVCSNTLKIIAVNSQKGDGARYIKLQNSKQTEIRNARTAFDNAMLNTLDETKKIVNEVIDENKNCIKYSDLKSYLDENWNKYAERAVRNQEDELRRQTDLSSLTYREELARLTKQKELSQEEQLQSKEVQIENETVTESESETAPESATGLERFLVSFFLGVLVYSIAYFMYFVFVRVIRGDEEFYVISGIRNFGGVYEYPYKKNWQRFLHDRRIYEIRRRRRKKPEQIVEGLYIKLSRNNINSINLISLGERSSGTQRVSDEFDVFLKNKGIKVDRVNIKGCVDNESDALFASMNTVFLELIGNSTKVGNLYKLHSMLSEYNVPIIGYYYVEV